MESVPTIHKAPLKPREKAIQHPLWRMSSGRWFWRKGYFPPVVGTPWVEDAAALTSILFRGVSGTILVNGERYASYMSPYGKDLSDEDILQIIHYVRHSLNAYPEDSSFSTDSIATIRAASKTAQTIRGQKGLDALLTASPSKSE